MTPVRRPAHDLISVRNCALCRAPGEFKLDKLGRPFCSCRTCMSRLFVYTPRAVDLLNRIEPFLSGAVKFHDNLTAKYREILESSDEHAGIGKEVRRALSKCFLCTGPAEGKPMKSKRSGLRGHFHHCRLCGFNLFLNSPLALAGLITRHGYLAGIIQRFRETDRRAARTS